MNSSLDNVAECKAYYEKILERTDMLVEMIPSNATVHSTLITTSGLTQNEYSGAFVKVITLDELFCRFPGD